MQQGDKYVITSANSLYYIPNSSCSEGSTVNLRNTQVVRVYNVDGKFIKSDFYTVSNYNDANYICHVWNVGKDQLNPNYVILPAVILVVCLFRVVFGWFNRMRG